jgi:3-methyladenine DNA glycosylase AlkC
VSEGAVARAAPDKLKHFFSGRVVRAIAADLHRVHSPFREHAFVAACTRKLADLELTARAWHIADVMYERLPRPFAAAAEILEASLGPELDRTEDPGLAPLRYMPHVLFVQRYGLEDFEVAMRAQYELTKRFSAESSIRAFLVKYPDATHARLVEWARDPNAHVRRLVSEGTRPRLPWATRLRAFQANPRPVLALLELLKDDPVRYVQRSVANNLNDIGKDHPDVVVETCQRWSRGAPAGRQWMVRFWPKLVRLGDEVRFSFTLASSAPRQQKMVVDYAVHFVKANGTSRPRVFKLKRLTLAPGEAVELTGRVSFARLTTRRHYAGRHRIETLVNGVAHLLGEIEVRP